MMEPSSVVESKVAMAKNKGKQSVGDMAKSNTYSMRDFKVWNHIARGEGKILGG